MHVRLKKVNLFMLSIVSIVMPTTSSIGQNDIISSNLLNTGNSTQQTGSNDTDQQAHEMHESSLVEVKFASQADHVAYSNRVNLRNRCKRAENELDSCAAQLLAFGLEETTFPNSMEQLESEYCPNFKKLVNCIKTNTDCYQPFEKQIINWVLTSSRKLNYKRCKMDNEKLRFLRLTSSCFAQMKKPMDKCMRKYIAHLEAIADLNDFIARLSENDYQIQLSCCANNRFKQCILNNAKQQCKPLDSLKKLKRTNSVSSQRNAQKQIQKVTQDTMDDLKFTLDGMALTGPEFICKQVDEVFCKTHFDGKITGRASKHKSIVPAMVKIYSNL